MALTASTPAKFVEGDFHDLPVAASETIYEGALVCVDADGHAVNLAADTYNGEFAGVAVKDADNASGADGAIRVKVRRGLFYMRISLSGFVQADAANNVYATDENTFTESAVSSTLIGKGVDVPATGEVIVRVLTDI